LWLLKVNQGDMGFEEFLNRRDRVALIVTPIAIIIFILLCKDIKDTCGPVNKRVYENLSLISNKNSITKAVIENGRYEPIDKKLDSMVIEDLDLLEDFRVILLNKKYIPMPNKSNILWTASVSFTLTNGKKLNVSISYANSDFLDDKDYIIDLHEGCDNRFFYGSKEMGYKVLELVRNSQ